MKQLLRLIALTVLASAAGAQTLPAGTPMRVKLENTLTTSSSHAGDPFSARVMQNVALDGKTVIPGYRLARRSRGE